MNVAAGYIIQQYRYIMLPALICFQKEKIKIDAGIDFVGLLQAGKWAIEHLQFPIKVAKMLENYCRSSNFANDGDNLQNVRSESGRTTRWLVLPPSGVFFSRTRRADQK